MSKICPGCGLEVDDRYIFCPQCDYDLSESFYSDFEEEDQEDDFGWEE